MIVSPRAAVFVAAVLAVVLVAVMVYGSIHAPVRAVIEPCAVVVERGGEQRCR